jgi:hypothetical protein
MGGLKAYPHLLLPMLVLWSVFYCLSYLLRILGHNSNLWLRRAVTTFLGKRLVGWEDYFGRDCHVFTQNLFAHFSRPIAGWNLPASFAAGCNWVPVNGAWPSVLAHNNFWQKNLHVFSHFSLMQRSTSNFWKRVSLFLDHLPWVSPLIPLSSSVPDRMLHIFPLFSLRSFLHVFKMEKQNRYLGSHKLQSLFIIGSNSG